MTIVFDLDGTLIDMSERWHALHRDLALKYGFEPIGHDEYMAAKREGTPERLLVGFLSDDVAAAYDAERISLIEDERYLMEDRPFPGVFDALAAWAKRGPLVLVTNRKSEETCRKQLDRLGLSPHFAHIVIVGRGSREELLRERVSGGGYFISDALEDRKTAEALSLVPVTVGWGARSGAYFARNGVGEVLADMRELTERAQTV